MVDIVERLRDWSEFDEGIINDMREEAADLIERLRKRDGFIEKLDEQIVEKDKEIDRLQDVLIGISCDYLDCKFGCYYDLIKQHCPANIARIALETK